MMKLNDTIIMEEMKLLLEYEAPVLREKTMELALGEDGNLETSGDDWVFGVAGDSDEEENGVFSLDDN